jgi:HD-GYP domain-containing protein (c-di-GMP phosphodiesterase class II)
MHHEKSDGSGYPARLSDEAISYFIKMITICDIYDAMISKRSYRNKICPFEIINAFELEMLGQLDYSLVMQFLTNIAQIYIGSFVELSNGEDAEVVFINQMDLSRPMVKTTTGEVLNLANDSRIKVVGLR